MCENNVDETIDNSQAELIEHMQHTSKTSYILWSYKITDAVSLLWNLGLMCQGRAIGKWRDHARIILIHSMVIEFTLWEYGRMPCSSVTRLDICSQWWD